MTINCNVTSTDRKRLAQVLGEILSIEPVYMKAPTFAYVLGDYTIDKDGAISCPESAMPVAVAQIIAKLSDEGFTPEIKEVEPAFADESAENTAPDEIPAETPNVAPVAEPEAQPEEDETEATESQQTPNVAASEEDAPVCIPSDLIKSAAADVQCRRPGSRGSICRRQCRRRGRFHRCAY